MTCRDRVKTPLDVYGIDVSVDTKMMKTLQYFLVNLAGLDYVRKPDVGTLKKEREDIFQNAIIKYLHQNSYVV